jgi:chromosome segregation ATPase
MTYAVYLDDTEQVSQQFLTAGEALDCRDSLLAANPTLLANRLEIQPYREQDQDNHIAGLVADLEAAQEELDEERARVDELEDEANLWRDQLHDEQAKVEARDLEIASLLAEVDRLNNELAYAEHALDLARDSK